MKWIAAKVIFEAENPALAEELIADLFSEFNLQGVVIEEPDLEPVEGWGEDALQRPEHFSVTGYLPDNELRAERIGQLERALSDLRTALPVTYTLEYQSIDEEDWAHSWKDYFWPEKVGKRCVVKPTWRDYSPTEDEIVIEIDPGMAFGTGTHPTTALCIGMIEEYMVPGGSFLDIGTGSGILMAAAMKLGAGEALGIDMDEVAVEIAFKNMVLNGIPEERFRVVRGDLASGVPKPFDLIAANILAEVIIALLDQVGAVMAEKGVLICSGIVLNQKERVIEKMVRTGFRVLAVQEKDGWVAISAERDRKTD
jgi:ribosomal protein L11 methyltransferase